MKRNPSLGYSPKTGAPKAVIIIERSDIAGLILYPNGSMDIQLHGTALKAKTARSNFNRLKRLFNLE